LFVYVVHVEVDIHPHEHSYTFVSSEDIILCLIMKKTDHKDQTIRIYIKVQPILNAQIKIK